MNFDPHKNVAEPLSTLERLDSERCKKNLAHFVRRAWKIAEPHRELEWNWHLDIICDALMAASRGEIKRLLVNVPPGTMKSWLVSVLWNCWEWIDKPYLNYLTFSHTQDLTTRDNGRVRRIVSSDWYQRYFPSVQLRRGDNRKTEFQTDKDGERKASSVGAAGVGRHPHRIIIDDPLNPQATRSDTEADIEDCLHWFNTTVSTRTSNDPVIAIIMQRLHLRDLAGHVLDTAKQGGRTYHHLCFQMEHDADFKYRHPDDPRTDPGELLCPALKSAADVEEQKIRLGEDAEGQLQQYPIPKSGGLFKVSDFEFVDAEQVPWENILQIRAWDTADHESRTADETVGVLGGFDYGPDPARLKTDDKSVLGLDFYVLHMQDSFHIPGVGDAVSKALETNELILGTAALDGREVLVREERGAGNDAKAVIRTRRNSLLGWDYDEMPTKGKSKATRANAFKSQCLAGKVKVVRGPWNNKWLSEHLKFRVDTKDDAVDATACCFNAAVKHYDELNTGRWGLWGSG